LGKKGETKTSIVEGWRRRRRHHIKGDKMIGAVKRGEGGKRKKKTAK